MGTQLVFKFVNLISFPVLILFACLIAPPYLIIKFVTFILSFFKAEDVSEKVILITGASSGIGEHLAYAYARRGACLALAARRENRLLEVAHKAKRLGSPKVLIITADVSKADDCKRIVDKTIDHFGRVDHLVNNAGVASACTLEKYSDITAMKPLMDINFWGAVYTTRFALPHLRKNKGKIVAVSSPSHWIALPTASSYNASKAAIVSLFETLRMEVASEISVVLLVPGFVESEMTNGKHITLKGDEMKTNETVRNFLRLTFMKYVIADAEEFAENAVSGICRGKTHLGEPSLFRAVFYALLIYPEVVQWIIRRFFFPYLAESSG